MKKLLYIIVSALFFTACDQFPDDQTAPKSSSGVKKASVTVTTDLNGNTVEQRNIIDRLKNDNLPGSIKHLYVISAYSGQVIIYSTVRGKVTSGNKRLTPRQVCAGDGQYVGSEHEGIRINISGQNLYTGEVLGDDGTYGDSGDYIYWFDSKGAYHQHYMGGGQIVHISDQPLAVKNIIINMENPEK